MRAAVAIGVAVKNIKKYSEASADERVKKAVEYARQQYEPAEERMKLEEIWLWITEATLVICGTLVNGFGDLII